jgi:hypothetical protein
MTPDGHVLLLRSTRYLAVYNTVCAAGTQLWLQRAGVFEKGDSPKMADETLNQLNTGTAHSNVPKVSQLGYIFIVSFLIIAQNVNQYFISVKTVKRIT